MAATNTNRADEGRGLSFSDSEIQQMTAAMFQGHSDWSGNVELVCPVCGFDYVHFGPVVERNGHDNYEAGWGGRGDAIWIPMACENGHQWSLRFGFDKGNTFVAVEDVQLPAPAIDYPVEEEVWYCRGEGKQ